MKPNWFVGLATDRHAACLEQLVLYTWAEDRRSRLFRPLATHPLAPPV